MELPSDILLYIFIFLSLEDRLSASLVCKQWARIFTSAQLWKKVTVSFVNDTQEEDQKMQVIQKFGSLIKSLKLVCNQTVLTNRRNACRVMDHLANGSMNLADLEIQFIGENPYFYSGQDFLQSLKRLFSAARNMDALHGFRQIDLRKLPLTLDADIVCSLADRNRAVHSLYLNNGSLVCLVSPECLLRVVKCCRQLSCLGVFHASLSSEVLDAFLEGDRKPLDMLEILCQRIDKYTYDIPGSMWKRLSERYVAMRVAVEFDHTVPVSRMNEILKPEIPVSTLRFKTFTYLVQQLEFTALNFAKTLTKLEIHTTKSEELNDALMTIAKQCVCLQEILCYCVLSGKTVQAFLTHCKCLRRYILKQQLEPHPWLPVVVV
ncbi:F-box/LRR-repeat protein 8-like [Petromyzon marinus]|uniref:F-box/LRR-repeat protein 8-like n=1 Tax=Petromyzon marinus TaxID=7757 RepID=UPI003F71F1C8